MLGTRASLRGQIYETSRSLLDQSAPAGPNLSNQPKPTGPERPCGAKSIKPAEAYLTSVSLRCRIYETRRSLLGQSVHAVPDLSIQPESTEPERSCKAESIKPAEAYLTRASLRCQIYQTNHGQLVGAACAKRDFAIPLRKQTENICMCLCWRLHAQQTQLKHQTAGRPKCN